MRTPASGRVFAKRSRICARTGMKLAAHSIFDFALVGQADVFDVAFLLFEYCHIFRFKARPAATSAMAPAGTDGCELSPLIFETICKRRYGLRSCEPGIRFTGGWVCPGSPAERAPDGVRSLPRRARVGGSDARRRLALRRWSGRWPRRCARWWPGSPLASPKLAAVHEEAAAIVADADDLRAALRRAAPAR